MDYSTPHERWALRPILLFCVVTMLALTALLPGLPVLPVTAQDTADTLEDVFTQVYNQVGPSVVSINVTVGENGRLLGAGTGSGFVIDAQGHIVTNNHVVNPAERIEIEFFDGRLARAEVVGLDPASDIAVLRVNAPGDQLTPIPFGDSDSLNIGETVLAIGSPFGEDWTLTSGIVSGLNRLIPGQTQFAIGGVIQTDAAINPGNSGGPLVNLAGEVVGVNSQIVTESGSSSGVGFAVPSNLVQRVVAELIADGTADYSYLGMSGTDINLDLIEQLELPSDVRGVVVTEVVSGSPAEQAGLQAASFSAETGEFGGEFDVITHVDGNAVRGMSDIMAYLARETTPGGTITFTVLRNGGETVEVPVTLGLRPAV